MMLWRRHMRDMASEISGNLTVFFNRFFRPTKRIIAPSYFHLWEKSTIGRRIPLTKGLQNRYYVATSSCVSLTASIVSDCCRMGVNWPIILIIYSAVIFFRNPGRAKWCMQYHVMLDCVITALGCIMLYDEIWYAGIMRHWVWRTEQKFFVCNIKIETPYHIHISSIRTPIHWHINDITTK